MFIIMHLRHRQGSFQYYQGDMSPKPLLLKRRVGGSSPSTCRYYPRAATVWAPMLSKRTLGFEGVRMPAAKRLRLNMADLCVSNDSTGTRAAMIFSDAHIAGAVGFDDVRDIRQDNHAHCNVVRKLLKSSLWPKLYVAAVRVWNRRREVEEVARAPMLLPHELLGVLAHMQARDTALYETAGLDVTARAHFERTKVETGCNDRVVPLGLWQDGVATKWGRSGSF